MKNILKSLRNALLLLAITAVLMGLMSQTPLAGIGSGTSNYLQNGNITNSGNITTTGWINATGGISSISLPYTYTISANGSYNYVASDSHGATAYTNTSANSLFGTVLDHNDSNVFVKVAFYNFTDEVDITNIYNLKVVGESWNSQISMFTANKWTLRFIGCNNIDVENLNFSMPTRPLQGAFTHEVGHIKLECTNDSKVVHNYIKNAYGYGVRVRANESNLAQESYHNTIWDNTVIDASHDSIAVHGGEYIDIEYNNCTKVFGANNGGANRADAQENIVLNGETTGGVSNNASHCTVSHNIVRGGEEGIAIATYTNPSYDCASFNTVAYNDIANVGNSSSSGPDMYLAGNYMEVGPDNIVQRVTGQMTTANIYIESTDSATGTAMTGLNIHDNILTNQVHWGIASANFVILNGTQIEGNNINSADGYTVVFQNSSNNGILMTGNTLNLIYLISGYNNQIYGNNGAGVATEDFRGPAYTLVYDGSYYYYAQNGTTGTMESPSSNFTNVWNYTLNNILDGSTIFLKACDYRISDSELQIFNRKNITVQGENWGTTIEQLSTAKNIIHVNMSSGIVIKDLTLQQHTPHVQSVSFTDEAGQIYFNACNDSLVDHVQFSSPYGYGVRIRDFENETGSWTPFTLSYRITVQNSLFLNASHNSIQISGGWECKILQNNIFKIYGSEKGGSQRTNSQESVVINSENTSGTVITSEYNIVDHNFIIGGQIGVSISTYNTYNYSSVAFNQITWNTIGHMGNGSNLGNELIYLDGMFETVEHNTLIRLSGEDTGALIYLATGNGPVQGPMMMNSISWNTLINNATGYVLYSQSSLEVNNTMVIGNFAYCNSGDYIGAAFANTTSDYNIVEFNISNKAWYIGGNSHGNSTSYNVVNVNMTLPAFSPLPDPP